MRILHIGRELILSSVFRIRKYIWRICDRELWIQMQEDN